MNPGSDEAAAGHADAKSAAARVQNVGRKIFDNLDRSVELIAVDRLAPRKANARTHSRKQVRQIADSITRFGFCNPVLIDDGNQIIAGHGRVEAAKSLGLEDVPALRLARGRRWLDELIGDPTASTESIAKRERCSVRKVNMTISLAFLAPDLVRAAIEGRLPHGMGVARLTDLPAEWSRQYAILGLST